MSLTPQCDTPGCIRPSVHVRPYEKILGKIRKAHRECPGCYQKFIDKQHSRKERP